MQASLIDYFLADDAHEDYFRFDFCIRNVSNVDTW